MASKGNKARTVYLGNGAKAAVTGWMEVRANEAGQLLYRIRKGGKIIPERLTDQAIWIILEKRVKATAAQAPQEVFWQACYKKRAIFPEKIGNSLHTKFQSQPNASHPSTARIHDPIQT